MSRSRKIWLARFLTGTSTLALIIASAASAQAADPPKDAIEKAQDSAKEATDAAQEAVDKAREKSKEAAEKAKQAVKDAQNRGKAVAKDARDKADETAEDAEDRANDATDAARERVRETVDKARDRAREYARGAHDQAGRLRFRSADIGIWFDRSAKDGLVIAAVGSEGAIVKLGFKEGDRIASVDGQKVATEAEFVERLFADKARDKRVEVIVMREGSKETIYVEPGLLRDEYDSQQPDPLGEIGVILDDRQKDVVLVWKVQPRSPAFYAGVRKGDVITTFHDQPVAAAQQFVQAIRTMEPGTVKVEVKRGEKTRELEFEMPDLAALRERWEATREEREERREERVDQRRERREARDDNETRREDRGDRDRRDASPRKD